MAFGRKKKPSPTGWRRVRRWIIRSSSGLAIAMVVLLAALSLLLSNLDRPVVSNPLADYLRQSLGIEVSFDELYASRMSELVGRNLRIASPPALRAHAPDVLTISRLSASWAPGSLLAEKFSIEKVQIEDVAVTIVVDEDGKTTLDYLVPDTGDAPSPAGTPPPPFVLSSLLASVPDSIELGSLSVDGLRVTVVELSERGVRRVTRLDGLDLRASLHQSDGRPSGTVHLLSHADPGASLTVDEISEDGTATSRAWRGAVDLQVDLGGRTLAVGLSSLLTSQTLLPLSLPSGEIAAIQARLVFLPDQQTTEVHLDRFELLDGVVDATLSATLEDRPDGKLDVHVDQGRVQLALDPLLPWVPMPEALAIGGGVVEADLANLGVDADTFYPTSGRIALSGRLAFPGWTDGATAVRARALSFTGSAELEATLQQDVRLDVTVAGLRAAMDGDAVSCERVAFSLAGRDTHLDFEDPWLVAGDFRTRLETQDGSASLGATRLTGADLVVSLASRLSGKQILALGGNLQANRLTVAAPSVGTQDLSGASIEAHVRDLHFDPDHPSDVRARVDIQGELGPLRVSAKVDQGGGETRWNLTLNAGTLAPLAPFLNPMLSPGERVAWDRMGIHLVSEGTATGLGGGEVPAIEQRAEVSARHLNYQSAEYGIRVPLLTGTLRYQGGLDTGRLDVQMKLDRWRYDVLWSDRPTWITVSTHLFLPADRYRVRVEAFRGDVHYLDDGLRVDMRDNEGTADIVYEQGAIQGTVALVTGRIDYADGPDHLRLEHVDHELRLTSTEDVETGVLRVDYRARAASMRQNYSDLYPQADIDADVSVRLARLSALSVDRLRLESERGGTRIELALAMDDADGNLSALASGPDLVRGARGASGPASLLVSAPITAGESLTVSGVLRQDLAALDRDPDVLVARGELVVPFRIESPEQVNYRVTSSIEFHGVTVSLPEMALKIEGLDGKCMVLETFRDTPTGFQLVPGARRNAYTRAAFPDTQPYLTGDSFFSIERLVWSDVLDAGPVAGNFRVDRNMIRLDQLQMNVAQGMVAGQLLIDYRGDATGALFRGTANGLRLARDSQERLDANVALDFSLDKLDLNGRAHIVRIGRKTLLAILDALDPYHEDVDINQVRLALKAGYPRFVRIDFDHGFMSLKIDLGGAAGAVRIDEIRGIPVGPMLNTYLGDLM